MKSNSSDPQYLIPYLWDGVSGSCAWDIGCGIGNTMTEMIFRFKTVVGFEPSKKATDYLRKIPPVKGVRVFELAISDHDGKVELDLEEGHVRVSCRSLDSLTKKLPMPDFIKVDVVGHEVEVLKGAEFIMITQAPEWLIEVYSAENSRLCQNILTRFGYMCTLILDPNDPNPAHHHWIRAGISRSNI